MLPSYFGKKNQPFWGAQAHGHHHPAPRLKGLKRCSSLKQMGRSSLLGARGWPRVEWWCDLACSQLPWINELFNDDYLMVNGVEWGLMMINDALWWLMMIDELLNDDDWLMVKLLRMADDCHMIPGTIRTENPKIFNHQLVLGEPSSLSRSFGFSDGTPINNVPSSSCDVFCSFWWLSCSMRNDYGWFTNSMSNPPLIIYWKVIHHYRCIIPGLQRL